MLLKEGTNQARNVKQSKGSRQGSLFFEIPVLVTFDHPVVERAEALAQTAAGFPFEYLLPSLCLLDHLGQVA